MLSQSGNLYFQALALLAGAIIAAPLFKRLGLGTVLGYLAAGLLIGPLANLITDGEQVLHFAELGVVFLLFVIGLELKPSRLWTLRRAIFGLGAAQVVVTGVVLTGVLLAFDPGRTWRDCDTARADLIRHPSVSGPRNRSVARHDPDPCT
jgi:CPA2 family monovalent cation:H+ antiporter-2